MTLLACCGRHEPAVLLTALILATGAGTLLWLLMRRMTGCCGDTRNVSIPDTLVQYYSQREAEGDDAGLRAELAEALDVMRAALDKPEDSQRRDAIDNFKMDLMVRDRRVVDVARELGVLIESDAELLRVFKQTKQV